MIDELDRVALTRSLKALGLEPGDVGTVVAVLAGGDGYTIEFLSLTGDTIAIETVPADAIRPVTPREIAHVREVA
jgi:Domain of unknown function (DUF4926)